MPHLRAHHSLLLIFCLSWIVLNGCDSKEPGRYYNDKENFSIVFPESWERQEGVMGTAVMALSQKEDPTDQFRENVNVVAEPLPRSMAVQEYYQLSASNMSRMMTDFQQVEQGELSLDEKDARWMVSTYRMGTINLKAMAYFLVKERRGFVITCSAAPDQFARYRKTFEQIAESFRLE